MKTLNNIPLTYNRNTWDQEIEGLRWHVKWQERVIVPVFVDHCSKYTMIGIERVSYFNTQKAAYAFIDERIKAKDYYWFKEPGWEEVA